MEKYFTDTSPQNPFGQAPIIPGIIIKVKYQG
jgi:hypothetical protein